MLTALSELRTRDDIFARINAEIAQLNSHESKVDKVVRAAAVFAIDTLDPECTLRREHLVRMAAAAVYALEDDIKLAATKEDDVHNGLQQEAQYTIGNERTFPAG